MRVVVLYHSRNDQFSGVVNDYAREFEHYKHKKLELLSIETIEGSAMAELYAIPQYPAILVISDDGSLQRLWQGVPLPLMDELSYYAQPPQVQISGPGRTIARPTPAKTTIL